MSISAERYEVALEILREAIKIDPTYWEAERSMAECLLALGRAGEALEHAQAALALRPSDRMAGLDPIP